MAVWGRRRDGEADEGGRRERKTVSVDWFGDPWITWFLGEMEAGRGDPELLNQLSPARRDYALSCLGADDSGFSTQFAVQYVRRSQTPNSVAILGTVLVRDAWRHRGRNSARLVSKQNAEKFIETLVQAERILADAVKRWPDHAPLRVPTLDTARGLNAPIEERIARWNALYEIEPTSFAGGHRTLQGIAAKWGGTDDLTYQFGRFCASAPEGGALLGMLPTAVIEHARRGQISLEQLDAEMSVELTKGLQKLLAGIGEVPEPDQVEALERFVHALKPIDRPSGVAVGRAIELIGVHRPPYPTSTELNPARYRRKMMERRAREAARHA